MNYRLSIVVGAGASFFLEDWSAGGVVVTPDVVGLFDVPLRADARRRFEEQLAMYGLERGIFRFMDLMRFAFSPAWTWQGARWTQEERHLSAVRRVEERLRRLLAEHEGDAGDRQKALLQLMQAAYRNMGAPVCVSGSFERPGGRRDRLVVYAKGIVAYDRTPHPLGILNKIAQCVSPRDDEDAAYS